MVSTVTTFRGACKRPNTEKFESSEQMYSNVFDWRSLLGGKSQSCVRHAPSYLVGLFTMRRELSPFKACLSTADVGSSRSAFLYFFLLSLHRNSMMVPHLRLVNLQSCPLNQMWQSESVQVFESGWNKVRQSTDTPIHLTMSKSPHKYLAPGDEHPPFFLHSLVFCAGFCAGSGVLGEVMTKWRVVQEARDLHQERLPLEPPAWGTSRVVSAVALWYMEWKIVE